MASGGSSFYKGSDLIHDYSCSTCEENDLNTEAQHFCPQCEHYLCDKCVKMHGDYFKKHVVYGREDIQKWTEFSMDRCDQHGKELEVHCEDHQELCCSVCVALNHRGCSSISHLPNLAKDVLKTYDFKQLPAEVDYMRCMLDKTKNDRMKDLASLNDSYNNIVAEIKAVRKKINQILDKLEKNTVEQLDNMMENLEKSIKDDVETCAHMHDQLGTMIEKLQQITGKNKESSSYIGFRKCQSKLIEANTLVQETREKDRMMFESDASVLPFLRNLNSLGNVDIIHIFKAQSSSLFNVNIKKDKGTCWVEGICELPSGEVVIADYNNDRVKLLNRQYEVIGHCDMPSHPQHLCHTKGSEVAVAICNSATHGIHFLTVTKGKIQAMRKLTTDHKCKSIAHHQGQLYVGSDNALYLYTMDGSLIKKIYENTTHLFTVFQCAITPDGERIYVTYPKASRLLTIDTSGKVLSTLEDPDLEDPTGICVSPSGHVFVCGEKYETVVQVDRDGRQKLTSFSSILNAPQSVWFSEQTSTLIVGDLGNNISVVKLC